MVHDCNPALGRQRQKEVGAPVPGSLGYIGRSCLKEPNQIKPSQSIKQTKQNKTNPHELNNQRTGCAGSDKGSVSPLSTCRIISPQYGPMVFIESLRTTDCGETGEAPNHS
jgi:hypothetical protein